MFVLKKNYFDAEKSNSKYPKLLVFSFCSTAPTDMRYSTDLCKEEKKFIMRRKEFVFEAMGTFLGDRRPQTIEEVSKRRNGFGITAISTTGWLGMPAYQNAFH